MRVNTRITVNVKLDVARTLFAIAVLVRLLL